MKFENEARALYVTAWNAANRQYRRGEHSHPVALKSFLHEKDFAYTIDLEVMNIPTGKIVGVAKASHKDLAYTADFLPTNPVESSFAAKWVRLYQAYLNDADIREPVHCYEYLGNFYVIDGMKRVSVAKCHGASTISALVTRLMPARTNDPQVQNYYEFLKHFSLTQLYQVCFSNPANFGKLQAALGHAADHRWTEMDRFGFLFYWYSFDHAFGKVFGESAAVTAADALVAVLEDRPYSDVRKMTPWDLEDVLQALRKKGFGTEAEVGKAS